MDIMENSRKNPSLLLSLERYKMSAGIPDFALIKSRYEISITDQHRIVFYLLSNRNKYVHQFINSFQELSRIFYPQFRFENQNKSRRNLKFFMKSAVLPTSCWYLRDTFAGHASLYLHSLSRRVPIQ